MSLGGHAKRKRLAYFSLEDRADWSTVHLHPCKAAVAIGLSHCRVEKSGKKEIATMTERILDECSRRGTCPLNRKEFDEAFAGSDLTIQIRAAIDFAQQNDLAFARSLGDQAFVFSRLPKVSSGGGQRQPANARPQQNRRPKRRGRFNRKARGSSDRPAGRSF
jgi:hypothetical protein